MKLGNLSMPMAGLINATYGAYDLKLMIAKCDTLIISSSQMVQIASTSSSLLFRDLSCLFDQYL